MFIKLNRLVLIFLVLAVGTMSIRAQSHAVKKTNVIDRELSNSPVAKTTGYMNRTSFEILPGGDTTTPRFQMVNGYRFTPNFSAGMGIGFTRYNDPLDLIPFFVDGTYTFLRAGVSPYISLGVGYNVSVLTDEDMELNNHHGGLMFNPSMGIQFATKNNFGWYLEAGFNIDRASYEQDQWGNRIVETDITYKRLLFGLGLSF